MRAPGRQRRRTWRAAFSLCLLVTSLLTPVASPTAGAEREPSGMLEGSIHAEEAAAHAADTIRFEPGGRVTVPFMPRAGDDRAVGGQRPRPLPAGRLSGAELAAGHSSRERVPSTRAASTATATSDSTALASPKLRREVMGFLPYWRVNDATTLDYRSLSTIAYFGVGASASGSLVTRTPSGAPTRGWAGWTSSRMTTIINDAHRAQTRVVLTVQRFGWTPEAEAETVALLSDPTARGVLSAEIATAVRDRGADGVNLDFEPIPDGQSANFVAFVREVRAALDARAPGYQLTFDATRSKWLANYDIAALTAPGAADAVFVMGYDYRTPRSLFAGAVAPLVHRPGFATEPDEAPDDLRATLSAYLAQTTPDKIILGLPYYVRAWSTSTAERNGPTRPADDAYGRSRAVIYEDAAALGDQHGRRYDDVEKVSWTVFPHRNCSTCPETWRQVYWDDERSLRTKYEEIDRLGLRGAGIWALGYDGARPQLDRELRKWLDRTAPVASAPRPRLFVGSTLRTPTIPLALDWSGRDELTWIARYDLEESVDGATWKPVVLAYAAATTAIRSVTSGSAYRYRVRAVDAAGNTSAWSGPVLVSPGVVEETSGAVTYRGTWRSASTPHASEGRLRYATGTDARARFTFTGRSVAWVAPVLTPRGQAAVYVDGAYVRTVDLSSATATARRLVFTHTWGSVGTHRLEIRVRGTTGRPRVDVDAFVVLG